MSDQPDVPTPDAPAADAPSPDAPSPGAPGELLPADKLFQRGLQYHRSGHLLAAQDIYRQLLEVFPDHPDVLHFQGVVAHQLGRPDEALGLLERALQFAPDHADLHANHGNVLIALSRLDDAETACRRALKLVPEHANAANSLGIVLRRTRRLEEAEQQFRVALQSNPRHYEATRNLCYVLQSMRRADDAVEVARNALAHQPSVSLLYSNLVRSLRLAGQHDETARVLREWLALEPRNVEARHLIQAYQDGPPPAGSQPQYVEELFDEFADDYDSVLQRIKYVGPDALRNYLADEFPSPANQYEILDAGCGTGLCGAVLRPYAKRLVGLDLSARMLQQARPGRMYDELLKTEIVDFLRKDPRHFDIIVASDVLSYFGDLGDFLDGSRQRLRAEGHLLFLLEKGTAEGPDYALQPSGRFTHQPRYLERALDVAGFQTGAARELTLRYECGEPVAGLLIHARPTS